MADVWASGEAYEPYVGRWSRLVADEFVSWLGLLPGARCVDVGCGTGALTSVLVRRGAAPTGVEPSTAFLGYARAHVTGATFTAGEATALPLADGAFDAAVSGLVLNFVPDHAQMVAEMRRVVVPGGAVGLYVWDYAVGMQLIRFFWDAAIEVDPSAEALDEAARFPVCDLAVLEGILDDAGLQDVRGRAIEVPTLFADFEAFWSPFLGRQGAAPAYLVTIGEAAQADIRETLRRRLAAADDGPIRLTARAFAVAGRT